MTCSLVWGTIPKSARNTSYADAYYLLWPYVHLANSITALCVCVYLQSLSADLRARKLEVDDLKAQIEAKDDALAAAGAETQQMHKVHQLAT